MNYDQLREFVRLENEEDEALDRLKQIKLRKDQLEYALINQFLADQVEETTLDGRRIGIKRTVHAWALAEQRELVIEGLKAAELAQYVKTDYNTQSLSKWVREIAEEVAAECRREKRLFTEAEVKNALPVPLCDLLKVGFKFELTSRKKETKG
jgi:hypothetical protein